jgi:hybrid cluster-associated redox disulfide protein
MVTLDTPLKGLFASNSTVRDMFRQKGLRCPECHGSEQDTIRKVANNHGLDPEAFLAEINKCLQK